MQHAQLYIQLRDQAQDGDTVALMATGLYALALRLGCMGQFGHVGIIRRVEIDGVTRVMVVEENPGGGHYRPLSHYQNHALYLYRPPVGIDGRAASGNAVKLLDGLAEYAWADIWRMAKLGACRRLAALLGQPLPTAAASTNATQMICSALVSAAYIQTGWQPAYGSAYPTALADQLGAPVLRYAP